MRLHLVAGLAVALLGSAVAFPLAARLALAGCVFLVLASEVANSALEALVDLVTRERHPLARAAKDAGAGAVLVLAAGSVVVLGLVVAGGWPLVVAAAGEQPPWRVVAAGGAIAAEGALLAPWRRPGPVDLLLGVGGGALLALSLLPSNSLPFAALGASLFAVACAAARRRRRTGAPTAV